MIPYITNGPEQLQYIWTPWCVYGQKGYWNADMKECVQCMIRDMKPTCDVGNDSDIINQTMKDNDFYTFMKAAYSHKYDV